MLNIKPDDLIVTSITRRPTRGAISPTAAILIMIAGVALMIGVSFLPVRNRGPVDIFQQLDAQRGK